MYYNPYILIPFATWAIAQAIKFALAAWRGNLDFKYLYASGGMPSVHSAVVCSLATTSLLIDGPESHLFGFILLFAAIVMYDSFGVRRSTGEQAVAINVILSSLEHDRIKMDMPQHKLREVLGHKPAEVAIGALLGIALGGLFNFSRLGTQYNYISSTPGKIEMLAYAVLFATMLVVGVVIRLVFSRRYRKSTVMKRLGRQIVLLSQTVGWLGLVAAFGQYQRLPYLAGRGWSWVMAAVLVIWAVYLVAKFSSIVPAELALELEQQRKKKWLTKKPKKRRK